MAICFSDALRIAKNPDAVPCESCQRVNALTTRDKIGIALRRLESSLPKPPTVLEECQAIMRAGHTAPNTRLRNDGSLGISRWRGGLGR